MTQHQTETYTLIKVADAETVESSPFKPKHTKNIYFYCDPINQTITYKLWYEDFGHYFPVTNTIAIDNLVEWKNRLDFDKITTTDQIKQIVFEHHQNHDLGHGSGFLVFGLLTIVGVFLSLGLSAAVGLFLISEITAIMSGLGLFAFGYDEVLNRDHRRFGSVALGLGAATFAGGLISLITKSILCAAPLTPSMLALILGIAVAITLMVGLATVAAGLHLTSDHWPRRAQDAVWDELTAVLDVNEEPEGEATNLYNCEDATSCRT